MAKISKTLISVLIIGGTVFGFASLNEGVAQPQLPLLVKEEKAPKAPRPLYVPGELIIKFKEGVTEEEIDDLEIKQGAKEIYQSPFTHTRRWRLPPARAVEQWKDFFEKHPLVEYAEPNYYAYATMVPNDGLYHYQWHLDNPVYGGIQMEQAWDIDTTPPLYGGDPSVIVAVVDTGVAYENYPAPAHWHIDTYNAYGGSGKSWWCGMVNSDWPKSPGYGNGWKDYLQHSFDLTGATGTVTFSYQQKYDVERNYDYAYVEVSNNNGASWTKLKTYTGSSGWKSESINLTGYKGKNILIRFRFNSDETVSDEDGHLYTPKFDSDGAFYVDEIKITDGSGTLFYDNVESGAGTWETTKYQKAPDLANTNFVAGYDFIDNDAHPNDDNAHGTHVAGTIAQTTNNNLGVAGIAFNTTIMPVKVLSATGSGTYDQVADGIYYAVNNGAKVINMSLGGPSPATVLENAVKYAYEHGVTVIAASGNSNSSSCDYPAAYDNYVIAVGATQHDESRAPYSNYGSSLDIVAPGGNTSVDQNGDGYADGVLQNTFGDTPVDWAYWFYQGTSMATPHVSGVAALLLARYPTLTPDQIRSALEFTAEDLGGPGRDDIYGWGLVDAQAALTPNLSVYVIPDDWPIGNIPEGSDVRTWTDTSSGHFTARNNSYNTVEDLFISVSNNANWQSGLNPGDDTFAFGWGQTETVGTEPPYTNFTSTGTPLANDLGPNDFIDFDLRFQAPTSTSYTTEQTIIVTIGAELAQ